MFYRYTVTIIAIFLLITLTSCDYINRLINPPSLSINWRDSKNNHGRVFQIKNLSDEFLRDIKVVVISDSTRNYYTEILKPQETIEVGWMQLNGYEPTIYSSVEVYCKDYRLPFIKKFNVQGNIDSLNVEHDIIHDGKEGIKIHFRFTVNELKGSACVVAANFYFKSGEPLSDLNGEYCTVNSSVCCGKDFTPTYDKTTFHDFTLFIPYHELHLNNGEHQLKFQVSMYDLSSYTFFEKSDYHNFEYSQSKTRYFVDMNEIDDDGKIYINRKQLASCSWSIFGGKGDINPMEITDDLLEGINTIRFYLSNSGGGKYNYNFVLYELDKSQKNILLNKRGYGKAGSNFRYDETFEFTPNIKLSSKDN